MLAAPTHTIPVCLFELHGVENCDNSDAKIVPSHNAKMLRNISAGKTKTNRKSRGFVVACRPEADRFGPGKLSRRHHQTERLRELRALRSAGVVRDAPSGARLARRLTSSARQSAKDVTGDNTDTDSRTSNKRPREHPCEAHRVVRHVPPPPPPPEKRSFTASPVLQPREHLLNSRPTECYSNTVERPIQGGRGHAQRARGEISGLDDSRLTSDSTKHDFLEADVGCRPPVDATFGPRHSPLRHDEVPGVNSGTMARHESGIGALAVVGLSPQILPVRCAPASRRPRADGGPKSVYSQGGGGGGRVPKRRSDDKQPQEELPYPRPSKSSHQQSKASIGSAGDAIAGCPTFSGVERNDAAVPSCFLAGNDQTGTEELPAGLSAGSKLGYPRIADACGGIVLRLTPAERSLEPWGSTLAPLRAMCDIEPSLSRAGIEYRGVIHAVEGAHERKSHQAAKHKKARNAKSLLGRDLRPRTSEPRLRIVGVTTELDVLKTILIRERLLVTLRRLIRKIRHHCAKLQDVLRRGAKHRRHHGKPPPGAVTCAAQYARKTLHAEQQELRVVLAHLRAVSLDTVKAVGEWRATFVASEEPGYRPVHRIGSAPSLSHDKEVPRLDLPAAQEEEGGGGNTGFAGRIGQKEGEHSSDSSHEHSRYLANQITEGDSWVHRHRISRDETHHSNNATDRRNNHKEGGDMKRTSRPEEGTVIDSNRGDSSSSSNSRDSPLPIFRWKGHNYLTKMTHDLNFLDDSEVSTPITAWLGFPVRGNPFIVPPAGHDICEALRRQQEGRREEIALRRRQRQKRNNHHHRFGGSNGGDDGQRRLSRSHSRSRESSNGDGDGRRLSGADRDFLEPSSFCGPRRRGVSDAGDGGDSLPTTAVSDQQPQPEQLKQQSKPADTEGIGTSRPQHREKMSAITPAMTGGGGGGEGDRGETKAAAGCEVMTRVTVAEISIGSASTSVQPPPLAIPGHCEAAEALELSSGEEEEVKWDGGGSLDAPIIPDLPRLVRSKASAAEAMLRRERASERAVESSAREIVANVRRTENILRRTSQALPGRGEGEERSASWNMIESLAERSSREDLRGVLAGRHVGAFALRPAAAAAVAGASASSRALMRLRAPCWEKESMLSRRVSTAPARGEGVSAPRRSAAVTGSAAVGVSAVIGAKESPTHGNRQGLCSAAFGISREGIRTSADGPGDGTADWTVVPDSRRGGSTSGDRDGGDDGGSSPCSHRRSHADRRTASASVAAGTGSLSFTCLTGPSAGASSSLQASSSSMSSRARERAVADRPTATRRPFSRRRGGGTIVIADPGKSADARHRAAALIQAAFFAASARRFARQLREDRGRGALVIGRSWRRSRVRVRARAAEHERRAGELRLAARNRAARVIQTFFRDVDKYRRDNDQHALSQRDPERVASEVREEKAATTVQAATRLFMACGRVKRLRHARRARAQTRIARAVRQHAAYLATEQRRRTEEEGGERTGRQLERRHGEMPTSYSAGIAPTAKRRSHLRPDEAVTLIQAWLRGLHCRRITASAAANAPATREQQDTSLPPTKTATKTTFARGSKSAHLHAALEALRAAHSAVAASRTENRIATESGSKALGQRSRKTGGQDAQGAAAHGAVDRENTRSGRSGTPGATAGAAATPTAPDGYHVHTPPSSPSSASRSPRVDGDGLRRRRETSARVSDRRSTPSRPKRA